MILFIKYLWYCIIEYFCLYSVEIIFIVLGKDFTFFYLILDFQIIKIFKKNNYKFDIEYDFQD